MITEICRFYCVQEKQNIKSKQLKINYLLSLVAPLGLEPRFKV